MVVAAAAQIRVAPRQERCRKTLIFDRAQNTTRCAAMANSNSGSLSLTQTQSYSHLNLTRPGPHLAPARFSTLTGQDGVGRGDSVVCFGARNRKRKKKVFKSKGISTYNLKRKKKESPAEIRRREARKAGELYYPREVMTKVWEQMAPEKQMAVSYSNPVAPPKRELTDFEKYMFKRAAKSTHKPPWDSGFDWLRRLNDELPEGLPKGLPLPWKPNKEKDKLKRVGSSPRLTEGETRRVNKRLDKMHAQRDRMYEKWVSQATPEELKFGPSPDSQLAKLETAIIRLDKNLGFAEKKKEKLEPAGNWLEDDDLFGNL